MVKAFSSWILYSIFVALFYVLWSNYKSKMVSHNVETLQRLKISRELLLRRLAKYMKEDDKMKEIMGRFISDTEVNNNN